MQIAPAQIRKVVCMPICALLFKTGVVDTTMRQGLVFVQVGARHDHYLSCGTSKMQLRRCRGVRHACTLRSLTSNKRAVQFLETSCGIT